MGLLMQLRLPHVLYLIIIIITTFLFSSSCYYGSSTADVLQVLNNPIADDLNNNKNNHNSDNYLIFNETDDEAAAADGDCYHYYDPFSEQAAALPSCSYNLLSTASQDDDLVNENLIANASVKIVNVANFEDEAHASADATQAFKKAWEEACGSSSKGAVVLVVPKNKNYLLKPIRFSGPCKSHLTLQIYGTIEASTNTSDYEKDERYWLVFQSVENLVVEGGGTLYGNGMIWWQNSCKFNKALALTFYKCKNLVVRKLKIQNAQQIHVAFQKSSHVQASNLFVSAPENSPNTDGIHVSNSQSIHISSCLVSTGDDCISIVNGSKNVQAVDITCGPGHGISVGSLGAHNSKAHVSDVTINGARLTGTTNGVRIKTWQGGSGSASNIKFQNVEMDNVRNPIIIDQNYCDQKEPCSEQASTVEIKNVLYQNIKGTSASEVAISFGCSKSIPCEGIVLQNISLNREGGGTSTKALCNNVEFTEKGIVSPHCP
ncbi:polygalacturonase-like isoform X2 [Malania oleifera]|uniref:polygalacturonase-like isoform X2 n=1 Tax=Malania oleifera TaxID=397392 RepID=UPI0025AE711C|nr:polygalacturonase-like isoform X2 [Malania oleifera]